MILRWRLWNYFFQNKDFSYGTVFSLIISNQRQVDGRRMWHTCRSWKITFEILSVYRYGRDHLRDRGIVGRVLKETGCECKQWVHRTRYGVQCQALIINYWNDSESSIWGAEFLLRPSISRKARIHRINQSVIVFNLLIFSLFNDAFSVTQTT
jgi:hypothetical protein